MAILAPPPQIQRSSQLPPLTVSAMLGTPLPIHCTNCHDKQLTCEAHPHTKGSCYHCILNGLSCLFPPNTILRHGSPRMNDAFVFSEIAFIAHEVTKNAYLTPILHCNANVV